jgi:hypothetical protein
MLFLSRWIAAAAARIFITYRRRGHEARTWTQILWNRWRWRRRTIFTVLLFDLRSHFLEAFAFIHHLHHVTRDANADVSSKAHSIEDRILGC